MDTRRPCTCGHAYQAHNRRYHYCVACVYDAQVPLIQECPFYVADTTPPEGDDACCA